MNIKIRIGLLLSLALFLASCSKEVEESPDMGYDFLPLKQGQFISYQVESIVWNDNNQSVDTSHFQMKMLVDTSFIDNLGRLSYRYIRFYKTDTTSWKYEHTFAITKTESRVETVEGNNRFVRLAFPVRLGVKWDVNAFNTLGKLDAEYIDVNVPFTINGKHFGQCAVALLEDNSSLINEYYQEDIYARTVGLVQRIDIHIDKKFTGEIVKGYKYKYQVYEYGVE